MKNKSLTLLIGTLISVVSFSQNNINALDSIKKNMICFQIPQRISIKSQWKMQKLETQFTFDITYLM